MVVHVKMMSKGSKEALTVLILTHVTVLTSKGSKVVFVAYVLNIDLYIQCYVERVKRLCYVETRDKHVLLITFLIFKRFSIQKKVLES